MLCYLEEGLWMQALRAWQMSWTWTRDVNCLRALRCWRSDKDLCLIIVSIALWLNQCLWEKKKITCITRKHFVQTWTMMEITSTEMVETWSWMQWMTKKNGTLKKAWILTNILRERKSQPSTWSIDTSKAKYLSWEAKIITQIYPSLLCFNSQLAWLT